MKRRITTLALATAALAIFAGCDTFSHRARQMSGVYDQLPASEQQRLQRGNINVGDSADIDLRASAENGRD